MRTVNLSSSVARRRRPLRGFTLIEMMIVVAIIGILARIAYPAYTDYVRRGSLPEAFSTLSSYQIKMEQYYQDNRGYGSTTTCGSLGLPVTLKYFTFSCQSASSSAYKIQADGVTGTSAAGHTYTIDQVGNKVTANFKGQAMTGKTCWMSKSGDC